jgi:hypothetical protein
LARSELVPTRWQPLCLCWPGPLASVGCRPPTQHAERPGTACETLCSLLKAHITHLIYKLRETLATYHLLGAPAQHQSHRHPPISHTVGSTPTSARSRCVAPRSSPPPPLAPPFCPCSLAFFLCHPVCLARLPRARRSEAGTAAPTVRANAVTCAPPLPHLSTVSASTSCPLSSAPLLVALSAFHHKRGAGLPPPCYCRRARGGAALPLLSTVGVGSKPRARAAVLFQAGTTRNWPATLGLGRRWNPWVGKSRHGGVYCRVRPARNSPGHVRLGIGPGRPARMDIYSKQPP